MFIHVTLHVSVWVEIPNLFTKYENISGHAPRERVSWNCQFKPWITADKVTLHVSVWVEIIKSTIFYHCTAVTLHVSVWVEM